MHREGARPLVPPGGGCSMSLPKPTLRARPKRAALRCRVPFSRFPLALLRRWSADHSFSTRRDRDWPGTWHRQPRRRLPSLPLSKTGARKDVSSRPGAGVWTHMTSTTLLHFPKPGSGVNSARPLAQALKRGESQPARPVSAFLPGRCPRLQSLIRDRVRGRALRHGHGRGGAPAREHERTSAGTM